MYSNVTWIWFYQTYYVSRKREKETFGVLGFVVWVQHVFAVVTGANVLTLLQP
jgi:hypothetical protein